DDEHVAALARLARELVAAPPHGRVDDRVEGVERGLIAHHLGAQRRTVERAVRGEDVRPEAPHDRGEHLAPWRLRLSHQLIGVDDRRAPAPEQLDDGRLAGGNIPRESYVEHRGQCGMRNAECGIERRASTPYSALRTPHLEKRRLILIVPRYPMTMPASRFVRLSAPDHDGGAVPQ